ncbi:hypothetical protein [Rhodovulum sp. FJ3]|uniref:hypothetical protein n=1 Tax=Rhodovulum sp. FJ3 TaxID=3079053 RepID=UPI00293DF509|nr:hypothetical protein [Rhodovulum sp. FJ3]MDV4168655.1 hypothetical protein [Rhodovulum sp. FJ3]
MSDDFHYQATAGLIKDLGMFAIKSMLTLNAGAIVVILTFLANISASDIIVFDIERIKCSVYSFMLGLCFVALAVGVTYTSAQRAVTANAQYRGLPLFLFIQMSAPILSFVAFLAGVGTAVTGVSQL